MKLRDSRAKTFRKTAYIEAIEENPLLSVEILAKLHQVTTDQIGYYLSPKEIVDDYLFYDQYPNFQECYELYNVIKRIKRQIPYLLNRVVGTSTQAIERTVRSIKESSNYVKEKPFVKYKFNGELMTISDIARYYKVSNSTIYYHASKYGLKHGDDFSSDLIGVTRNRDYIFLDEYCTVAQIAEALHVSYGIIRHQMMKRDIKPGQVFLAEYIDK